MNKIQKGNRYGFELSCGCCAEATLFRSQKQLNDKPLHFCRKCAAAKGTYYAAIKNRVHHQDTNFFQRESLESYYWAGFIAADGYINEKSNYVSIKLTESDSHHLQKFLDVTQSSNTILNSNDITDIPFNKKPRKRIVIRNPNWVKILKDKFNLHQAKSLTHEPPNDKLWSIDQIKSYIIGYLDGDGTICFLGSDKYLKLGFIGTLEFLTWIKNHLITFYKIELKETCIQHKKNCPEKNVYELSVYCSKANKILTDLNKLPIYKLERKWNKL